MSEIIQNFDLWLFGIINGEIVNSLFDKFFPFITIRTNWFILYAVLTGWLLWKGGKKGRIAVVVLVLTILISDQISASYLKPLIERPRPCHFLTDIRLLIDCGPGYSFPSNHAVNSFAAAAVLSFFFKDYKYVFYILAFLVAYSRVYVGVHFPIDIAAGALLGLFIAFLVIKLYQLISNRVKVLSV